MAELAGFVPSPTHQGDDAQALKACGRRRARRCMSPRRQDDAEAVARELASTKWWPRSFPEDKGRSSKRLRTKAAWWRWRATGSTTPRAGGRGGRHRHGTGTDVAMESAGITLLKGDLMGIVRARKLSHATMRNIRQNLFLCFVYNVAGIPLRAGVLYPFFGLLLSPVVAAAAMALSSVSVIGNALRLRTVTVE
jgi:Cu+-exporting ATPase